MERFDIETFNRNKIDGQWNYTLSDGKNVSARVVNGEYIEEILSPTSLHKQGNRYYSNGMLKIEAYFFLGMHIGVWKYYDLAGNLEKEVDYDADFKMSVDDIAQVIMDKFNVDISAPSVLFSIQRSVDTKTTNLPLYYVFLFYPPEGASGNHFTINGNDGEVLEIKSITIGGDRNRPNF